MSSTPQAVETYWGTVAENSIFGKEEVILVFLNEAFPNNGGKLEVNPEIFTVKGKDAKGKHYTIKTNTNSAINATFLPRQSNRITAPQMKKGERVLVHRFQNENTYYWEPMGFDNHRKTQETVVFSYAAKSGKVEGEPTTPENSYSQTFDGTNGMIEQRMTAANGEMSPWVVQYDAKNGVYTLTDQRGNTIRIDTGSTVIDIINADQSHVQLDGKTINIFSHDVINMTSTNQINIQTKELNIQCQQYTHSAETVNWNISGETTVNCPTINLNGIVNVGSLNTTGTGSPSSDAKISGNVAVEGNTNVTGSLSATGPVNFTNGNNNIAGYD